MLWLIFSFEFEHVWRWFIDCITQYNSIIWHDFENILQSLYYVYGTPKDVDDGKCIIKYMIIMFILSPV